MGNDLSRYTTHVANGSNHTIWVFADSDRFMVTSTNASFESSFVKAAGQVQQQLLHTANSYGFTKILPGNYLPFKLSSGPVYVSIISQEAESWLNPVRLHAICSAYPIALDQSLVVGNDDQVHPVIHGELWINTTGKDHSRITK